jgi:hypothetical protein
MIHLKGMGTMVINTACMFKAGLEVDQFGLVVAYGDFWRRVT